jgi:Gram-negative bacterial TonB protein C-terminal
MSPRKSQLSVAGIALLMAFVGLPLLTPAQSTGQPTDNSVSTQRDPAGGTNEVYKIGNDVSAPKLIHVTEPKLSKAAKKSNEVQTTWVKLKLDVETDGSVSNISVVGVFNKSGVITDPDSNPILNELEDDAVEAAKLYKFEPGKKNGKAVVVELNVTVSFAHT